MLYCRYGLLDPWSAYLVVVGRGVEICASAFLRKRWWSSAGRDRGTGKIYTTSHDNLPCPPDRHRVGEVRFVGCHVIVVARGCVRGNDLLDGDESPCIDVQIAEKPAIDGKASRHEANQA